MPIPEFREDGYLPEGLHAAEEAEVLFRFGTGSKRRRALALRLRRWLELARDVKALRFLVDGSFVTSKAIPGDVDAVVWLPADFEAQMQQRRSAALEINAVAVSGQPKQLFAVFKEIDWLSWIAFFTQTRKDDPPKGMVEVIL